MFTEINLWVLNGTIRGLIGLLPPFIIDGAFEGVAELTELIMAVNFIVPIKTLGACLGVVIGFFALRFVISLVNWLIAKIPTIS